MNFSSTLLTPSTHALFLCMLMALLHVRSEVQAHLPSSDACRQQIVEFKVDVLVVIGDDRLHSQLETFAVSQHQRKPLVVKLSKSGGVITRSSATRHSGQSNRIREYFYGIYNDLCPYSSVVDLTTIQVQWSVPLLPPSNALRPLSCYYE